MKEYALALFNLFLAVSVSAQSLNKPTFQLDTPAPSTRMGGNGISVLQVQETDNNTFIWIGTGGGVSRLDPLTNEWRTYNRKHGLGLGGVSAIAVEGDVIWAATVFDSTIGDADHQVGGGLVFSLNGGEDWKYVPQPWETPVDNTTWDIGIDDTTVWITSFGSGLMKSTDWRRDDWLSDSVQPTFKIRPPDEYNFDPKNLINHRAFSVLIADDIIWVGTAGGINKSLDGGETWVNFNHQNQAEPISGNWVLAIAQQKWDDHNIIWASTMETSSESEDYTEYRGISKSEDGGYSWKVYLEGIRVENFAFDDSVVYACTEYGLFKSLDGGENWAVFPPIVDRSGDVRILSEAVYSAAVTDGHVLWAGAGDGLAKSSDNGLTWDVMRAFVPTGKSGEPRTYAYPNPFSPMRHNQIGSDGYIRFQYDTINNTNVTIRVFDFAMELVATVVENKSRPAGGDFAEIWNGRTSKGDLLANGPYFYQLVLDGDGTYWGKILILD
ncbi:hypothetical protein JW960_01225 [candidate division KSB1 bacterium]|nr:hypothetical protein [candidate division KSB1 bacterium]